MADPLKCLRGGSITIAIWNIIYSVIQMAIMGWQLSFVRDRMFEYENRYLPATGIADGLQDRFPGLYAIYIETPERRRINAMYVIVIINVILSIANFFASFILLYGCIKYQRCCILPWLVTSGGLVVMSTVYACMWWSGDIFNEQLVMSVAEFVMSLAINGICFVIVVFYYARLSGGLTSDKPAKRHKKPPRRSRSRDPNDSSGRMAPEWREQWDERPPRELEKKIRRENREREKKEKKKRREDPTLDFYSPEPYDIEFPWKLTEMQRKQERAREEMRTPKTAGQIIRELYYEDYPDEKSTQKEVPQRHRERQISQERHRKREYLSAI